MSLLDLLVVIVIGSSVAAGLVAGFARVSIGFLAAILGVVFGFWFYGIPAGWVHRYLHSAAVSNLIGFLLVFWAILAIGALVAKVTSRLFKWTGLSWLDRILGASFGFVRGGLAAVALVSVLMAFTPRPVPAWMTESALLPYAIDGSNIIASLAPRALKDPVRDTIREIRQAWDDQVHKSRMKEEKREKEPKSPPPRPVNQ